MGAFTFEPRDSADFTIANPSVFRPNTCFLLDPTYFFHWFFPGTSRRSGGPTHPPCPFVGRNERFRSRRPFGSPRRRPRSVSRSRRVRKEFLSTTGDRPVSGRPLSDRIGTVAAADTRDIRRGRNNADGSARAIEKERDSLRKSFRNQSRSGPLGDGSD